MRYRPLNLLAGHWICVFATACGDSGTGVQSPSIATPSDSTPNAAPLVSAGEDQTVALPDGVILAGVTDDDGLPNPPARTTVTWSLLSGAGTVVFSDQNGVETSASFSRPGEYALQLTAHDGELSSNDTLIVTVISVAVNQSPAVAAGPDFAATVNSKSSLDGSVSDDGLPNPPGQVATTWSRISGPGIATIADPTSLKSAVSFTSPGIYELQLEATDGELRSSDSLLVTATSVALNHAPTVDAGADYIISVGTSALLGAIVSDDGLPDPPASLSTEWSVVSGPGAVHFADPANPMGAVSFDTAGTFALRLTVDDGEAQQSDDVTVRVIDAITQRVFSVSADTFVSSSQSNANFGSQLLIRVQDFEDQVGFAQFGIGEETPATVSSATLSFTANRVEKGGTVTLHKVLGKWDELVLTDGNKPALGPALTSFTVSAADTGRSIEVDITDILDQLLVSPADNFGIALVPNSVNLWIDSRESGSPMIATASAPSDVLLGNDDSFNTAAGVTVNGDVLEDNGSGKDLLGRFPATAQLISTPQFGQLSWSATGTFRYVPDTAYVGSDSFSYSLHDTSGAVSDTAQVTVHIGEGLTGKPNVLFFVADDMGWGDLQTYNARSLIDMPNIEQLASEGIYFTDAHTAASKCAPSRYSALTGNYQWRGRWKWGQWKYKGGSQILQGQQTLGDMLQNAGYVTASIGKQHLGGHFYLQGSNTFAAKGGTDDNVDFSRAFEDGPLAHGFNYSFNVLRGIQAWPYAYFENDRLVGSPSQMQIWGEGSYGSSTINRTGIGMPYWNSSKVGPDLVDSAIAFIDSHQQQNNESGDNRPFFMYYASQSAHGPHTPPVSLLGEPVKGVTGMTTHTDMIYEIDVALGKLIAALESHNLVENTVIIFTSDNGGMPSEKRFGHDAVGGLRGRKGQIFEGGHRVPLIFKWGDGTVGGSVFPPASQTGQLVAIQDVVATVAAIADITLQTDQAVDSYNLLPILLAQHDENNLIRPSLIMEADEDESGHVPQHFAVRDGSWKLTFDEDRNPAALFNLDSDLAEVNNLVDLPAHQQRVQKMTDLLNEIFSSAKSAP